MNIGRIARVIGPVVDVEFEEGKLPAIKNGLFITNPAIDDMEDNLVVEVAAASGEQHGAHHRHGHHRRSGAGHARQRHRRRHPGARWAVKPWAGSSTWWDARWTAWDR